MDDNDVILSEVKFTDFCVALVRSPNVQVHYVRIVTTLGKIYIPLISAKYLVKCINFVLEAI